MTTKITGMGRLSTVTLSIEIITDIFIIVSVMPVVSKFIPVVSIHVCLVFVLDLHIALNIEPLHCAMPASANYLPSVFHEDDTNLSGDQQPVNKLYSVDQIC